MSQHLRWRCALSRLWTEDSPPAFILLMLDWLAGRGPLWSKTQVSFVSLLPLGHGASQNQSGWVFRNLQSLMVYAGCPLGSVFRPHGFLFMVLVPPAGQLE